MVQKMFYHLPSTVLGFAAHCIPINASSEIELFSSKSSYPIHQEIALLKVTKEQAFLYVFACIRFS